MIETLVVIVLITICILSIVYGIIYCISIALESLKVKKEKKERASCGRLGTQEKNEIEMYSIYE